LTIENLPLRARPLLGMMELLDATRLAILTCLEGFDSVLEERFAA